MSTAALVIWAKLNGEHRRIEHFAFGYYKLVQRLEQGEEWAKPLPEEERDQIITDIVKAELQITKTMFGKEGEIIGVDLPYKYLGDYVHKLFSKENQENIYNISTLLVNDIWYTTIPLSYGPKEIAFACVLFAARKMEYPIDKIAPDKLKRLIRGDESKEGRSSGYWNFDEVIIIIPKITKFYTDMHAQMREDRKVPEELEWKEKIDAENSALN